MELFLGSSLLYMHLAGSWTPTSNHLDDAEMNQEGYPALMAL